MSKEKEEPRYVISVAAKILGIQTHTYAIMKGLALLSRPVPRAISGYTRRKIWNCSVTSSP